MEYPKNWEAEIAGWDAPEDVTVIVTDEEDGPTAVWVKNINWAATIKANWKKIAAAVAVAAAVITAVVVVAKLLSNDD